MDSITHLALGACMGEAFAGKKIGKTAMLWGALAQSIPDIDFVAAFFIDTTSNLLAHRGLTHSILFCLLITPLLALVARKFHRSADVSFTRWILFFGIVIFLHVLTDSFNNYGVGWFEPFSKQRFSFNAIYVADPFFSIWPLIACTALLILKRQSKQRRKWWIVGLGMSAMYLVYCLVNKSDINGDVKSALAKQQISYDRFFTTPTPLQNWLWYIVAGTDSGYHVGFRSVFDRDKRINFHFFPRNDSLLAPYKNNEDVAQLIRFSQGYYTVEHWHDTLVFNDLRFGQVVGWQFPTERFAFHYFLQYPDENILVVQRGRFSGWNKSTTKFFIRRVKGN